MQKVFTVERLSYSCKLSDDPTIVSNDFLNMRDLNSSVVVRTIGYVI